MANNFITIATFLLIVHFPIIQFPDIPISIHKVPYILPYNCADNK